LAVRQHFATLDGLRGVAAVVIVAHHAFDPFDLSPLIPHSGLAVDLLFCLSGFVLGYAYEARLLSTMSLLDFLVIRFIRLYPLILLGTLLGFAIFTIKSVTSHQSPFAPNYIFILITELFLIPTSATVGHDGWDGITPFDTPAWSLFFQFLANFVYAAFIRRLTNTTLAVSLLIGAVIVLAQSYLVGGVQGGGSWHDLYGGFSRVFFSFFCGVFLFRRWRANPSVGKTNYSPIILVAVAVVLFCPVPSAVNWLFESLAVILIFPIVINAGARDAPGPRSTAFFLFVGRLAYPLYILHYPVLRVFIKFEHANALQGFQLWLVLAVGILTAIGFSLVIMLFFDEPVRAWLSWKWQSWRKGGPCNGIEIRGLNDDGLKAKRMADQVDSDRYAA
jgi:peptidoglycan/LPS O-acetylase OafA/YrhL